MIILFIDILFFNGATDWLAAVLPTNQKPGLKIPFNSLVKHENFFIIRSSDNDSTSFWPPGSLHTLGAHLAKRSAFYVD